MIVAAVAGRGSLLAASPASYVFYPYAICAYVPQDSLVLLAVVVVVVVYRNILVLPQVKISEREQRRLRYNTFSNYPLFCAPECGELELVLLLPPWIPSTTYFLLG